MVNCDFRSFASVIRVWTMFYLNHIKASFNGFTKYMCLRTPAVEGVARWCPPTGVDVRCSRVLATRGHLAALWAVRVLPALHY